MNILYIEDDLIDQMSFKRIIRSYENIQLSIATTINQVKEILASKEVHFIFSDGQLSEGELENFINDFKGIPFAVVTGNLAMGKKYLDKGALSILPKPVTHKSFIAFVNEFSHSVEPPKLKANLGKEKIVFVKNHILNGCNNLLANERMEDGDMINILTTFIQLLAFFEMPQLIEFASLLLSDIENKKSEETYHPRMEFVCKKIKEVNEFIQKL